MNVITDCNFCRDYHFWLLLFVINMSGNICFGYYFPDKVTIICLALFVTLIFCIKQEINLTHILFISCFFGIFALQAFCLSNFSLSSSIHFLLKIYTGFAVAVIIGEKFIDYYKKIILFFCLISLFCFTLNCLGIVIPYINISSSSIDGGQVIRVSSFVYTQLYNIEHGLGLTLRNCGPFWEPGAFQGFVNLALLFEMFSLRNKNKLFSKAAWIYIITVFTTLSTGGYVTMFAIVGFLTFQNNKIPLIIKCFFLTVAFLLFAYLFFNLEFLGDKISRDAGSSGGRLSLDFSNVSFDKLLIGSGLDPKSFMSSSLVATGSLVMLINFTGLLGGLVFFGFLFRSITIESSLFILIVSMILINEPFLTAGPFWWCAPELVRYINNDFRTNNSVKMT